MPRPPADDKNPLTRRRPANKPPPKGFRVKMTWQALNELGRDPTFELIRIADMSEAKQDYATAAGIWKELKSYVMAKPKAFDPGEDKEREARLVTLEELRKLKTAILAGEVTAIDDKTIIEERPAIQDLEVIEHKPDTDDLW